MPQAHPRSDRFMREVGTVRRTRCIYPWRPTMGIVDLPSVVSVWDKGESQPIHARRCHDEPSSWDFRSLDVSLQTFPLESVIFHSVPPMGRQSTCL